MFQLHEAISPEKNRRFERAVSVWSTLLEVGPTDAMLHLLLDEHTSQRKKVGLYALITEELTIRVKMIATSAIRA